MLQNRFRMILLIVIVLTLVFMVQQMRVKKLDIRYSLSWLLLVVVLLSLVIAPSILDRLSSGLGVYSPVNMLFLLGFVFSLIIIYSLTLAISKMAEEIKRLAQELALLQKLVEENKEGDV